MKCYFCIQISRLQPLPFLLCLLWCRYSCELLYKVVHDINNSPRVGVYEISCGALIHVIYSLYRLRCFERRIIGLQNFSFTLTKKSNVRVRQADKREHCYLHISWLPYVYLRNFHKLIQAYFLSLFIHSDIK